MKIMVRAFLFGVIAVFWGTVWAGHEGASIEKQVRDAMVHVQLGLMNYRMLPDDYKNIHKSTKSVNNLIAQATDANLAIIRTFLEEKNEDWAAQGWRKRQIAWATNFTDSRKQRKFLQLYDDIFRAFRINCALRGQKLSGCDNSAVVKQSLKKDSKNVEFSLPKEMLVYKADNKEKVERWSIPSDPTIASDAYVGLLMRIAEENGTILYDSCDDEEVTLNAVDMNAKRELRTGLHEYQQLLLDTYRSDARFFEMVRKKLIVKNDLLKKANDGKKRALCSFVPGFNFDQSILDLQETISDILAQKTIESYGISVGLACEQDIQGWTQFANSLESQQRCLKAYREIQRSRTANPFDRVLKSKKLALLKSINNACTKSLDSYEDEQLKNPQMINGFVDDLICYYNKYNTRSKRPLHSDEDAGIWRGIKEKVKERLSVIPEKVGELDGELSLDNCKNLNRILQKPGSTCYESLS